MDRLLLTRLSQHAVHVVHQHRSLAALAQVQHRHLASELLHALRLERYASPPPPSLTLAHGQSRPCDLRLLLPPLALHQPVHLLHDLRLLVLLVQEHEPRQAPRQRRHLAPLLRALEVRRWEVAVLVLEHVLARLQRRHGLLRVDARLLPRLARLHQPQDGHHAALVVAEGLRDLLRTHALPVHAEDHRAVLLVYIHLR